MDKDIYKKLDYFFRQKLSSLLNPNNSLNFGLKNRQKFSLNNSLKFSPKFRLKNRLQFRPKFSLKFGGQNNICTHYIRTIYYNTILLYYIKQYKKIIYITIYIILRKSNFRINANVFVLMESILLTS